MNHSGKWSIATRVWLFLFSTWAVLLTGVFAQFSVWSPPGLIQWIQLRRLLESKDGQVALLESSIKRLDGEKQRLEKSRVAQEREIRRVLGYAAADEIIFDFTASERWGGWDASAKPASKARPVSRSNDRQKATFLTDSKKPRKL